MLEPLIETTLAALKKHRFEALYVASAEEAKAKVLELIPPDASVGMGGSVTTRKIGLREALDERGNEVFDHVRPGLPPEQKRQVMRAQLTSDVFLTSSNAVTAEGEIVNVDGAGNRIAALSFGPGSVIIVVGKNKLVPDLHAGLERIRAIAGPKNARRLELSTPCVEKQSCQDCASPSRICNATHILRRPLRSPITIIIVGEDLGY